MLRDGISFDIWAVTGKGTRRTFFSKLRFWCHLFGNVTKKFSRNVTVVSFFFWGGGGGHASFCSTQIIHRVFTCISLTGNQAKWCRCIWCPFSHAVAWFYKVEAAEKRKKKWKNNETSCLFLLFHQNCYTWSILAAGWETWVVKKKKLMPFQTCQCASLIVNKLERQRQGLGERRKSSHAMVAMRERASEREGGGGVEREKEKERDWEREKGGRQREKQKERNTERERKISYAWEAKSTHTLLFCGRLLSWLLHKPV